MALQFEYHPGKDNGRQAEMGIIGNIKDLKKLSACINRAIKNCQEEECEFQEEDEISEIDIFTLAYPNDAEIPRQEGFEEGPVFSSRNPFNE